jgi:hypothetical protein
MDNKGKEIVDLRDRLKSQQNNFRTFWQDIANLIYPQTFPIVEILTPGTDLMSQVFDVTAILESENMASGLSNNIMPPGQQFFAVRPQVKKLMDMQRPKRYLGYVTEKTHEFMFNSNMGTQVDNVIHSWLAFGIGNLYTEWNVKTGLNFREYGIGMYQCSENAQGIIDTCVMTMPMTAEQCVERWGLENVGEQIGKAWADPDRKTDKFNIVWVVRPRNQRNPRKINNRNMAWESCFIGEDDKHTIEEGGYPEFPFSIPRYRVVYGEVYGRGLGTMGIRQVRYLNRLRKDFMEMSNKWVNPPREVLDTFDGQYDVTPGAVNYVTQIPSSREVIGETKGSPPVGKDMLEYEREGIREMFFKNVFEQLSMLTGDRRTTIEIIERLREGMKKLSKPIGRLFNELFDTMITRSVLLLIRNGQLPPPPPELQGQGFKIEYYGPLALALRDQQSRGFQYWIEAAGLMEGIFPGIRDNVDYDKGFRDLGESLGVKTEHIRPVHERDAIRQQRQQQQQDMMDMQAAQMAAEGYGKVTKAPEEGSPAQQLQEA